MKLHEIKLLEQYAKAKKDGTIISLGLIDRLLKEYDKWSIII